MKPLRLGSKPTGDGLLGWQIATTLAFLGLLILLTVSAVLISRSTTNLQSTQERFVASSAQVEVVDRLLRELTDAETGQRGYLLTHDMAFLVPYSEAVVEIPTITEELGKAMASSKAVQGTLQELKDQIAIKMQEMQQTIQLAQNGSLDLAVQRVASGRGKAAMDEIRRLVGKLHDSAAFDREATRAARDDLVEQSRLNLTVMTATAAIFLIGVYLLVIRSLEAGRSIRMAREQRAEELERAVQERTTDLMQAIRELEGFTYSVSHDMRTPLRWIVSSSQILIDDYGDQFTGEAESLLRRQIAAGIKMSSLIDDLLHYARLARQPIESETVDLSQITREIMAEHRDVKMEMPNQLLAKGDPTMLRIVLQNLLENSVKYRSKTRVPLITLGTAKTEHGTAFFVRDNGIGFDQKYLHKIFLPFERLHRDTEYPGTGIGLANVQRIVERHGGKVWAGAAEDEGATFFFTLP